MKLQIFALGVVLLASCSKDMEQPHILSIASNKEYSTRVYGEKTPKIMVYIETNDVNPLNAGDYYLPDGTPVFDMVEFFASNIHKRIDNGILEPTLYLNPELTRLLEPDPQNPNSTGYKKYVRELQEKGIRVLITVIGDWQGIGLATMNNTQTTQFAQILAHVVEKYELDGIGFSDHYANASSLNLTSYSEIISKLHDLMPSDKLITVNDWGATNTLNTDALACIDYIYHGYWGYNNYITPNLNIDRYRWSPISLNIGNVFTKFQCRTLSDKAYFAYEDGYGAICSFNLRTRSDRDPSPVLEAIIAGAYYEQMENIFNGNDQFLYCANGDRPQDWPFIPGGYTITMDEIQ